jgi:glucose/arabinose dehydrogenase
VPRGFTYSLLIAIALMTAPAGHAQTPAQDAAAAPALELTTAQRQTVFQSISRMEKNHAAPTGFRISIGAHVPDGIELAPLPDTLATLIPAARGYAVAMVEKQVMIVDGKTRQVVAVVTGAP